LRGVIHTTMILTNKSDSRQAFKVKCTRNDLFRIRPATGILDYGQSIQIDITYRFTQFPCLFGAFCVMTCTFAHLSPVTFMRIAAHTEATLFRSQYSGINVNISEPILFRYNLSKSRQI
uniref:MSP domain-containing protein n=1 Tax=Gongylonema pulchrum TaxID=637853 RepID=A0A183DAA8_9BILA